MKNKKVELLAPAGNLEKLETAIHFGADAVYLASKNFSLRNFSDNFSDEELQEAINFAHKKNVKVYLACNIYSKNSEQKELTKYIEKIGKIEPDAIIVADFGILKKVKEIIPHIDIHLSTQANTTNYNTCLFMEELGVKRVNLARELSLEEIKEIRKNTNIEIECFVHGAMCISYSGRCLLSAFMVERSANSGFCAHSCRWKYSLCEELRPNEYMPVAEDKRGTYILNSKDLCMIEHIKELIEAGIDSFKIEGRMKSINYVGSVIKIYREALDTYYKDPKNFKTLESWKEELSYVSNRKYTTAFYFNEPDKEVMQNYTNTKNENVQSFAGKVEEKIDETKVLIASRNKIEKNMNIVVLEKGKKLQYDSVIDIQNEKNESVGNTKPNEKFILTLNKSYPKGSLIRSE